MENNTYDRPYTGRQIKELSDQLISQIAAGEVIERPASVVKELVENAVDAGSTSIEVRLEGGGVKRIVVADNGCGIPREELPLALKRHATSKVRDLRELESVSSLGFRGEALASIASVADLKIISRRDGADAFSIMDGEINPASGVKGTRIEVSDLFYKTPARRKFLKSEATELAHCVTCIERIALAYPGIEFSVFVNGKSILSLPGSDLEERLTRLMNKDFRDAHRAVNLSEPGLSLVGWVGLPTAARAKADNQYFYVNGRFVKDKVLSHAVRQAYSDVLHGHSQPSYCLFLDLNPTRVDVNVHPTKSEVRFRDSQQIHQLVFHAVEDALARTTIVDPSSGEIIEQPQNVSPQQDADSSSLDSFKPSGLPKASVGQMPLGFRPNSSRPSVSEVRQTSAAYFDFASTAARKSDPMPTKLAAYKVDAAPNTVSLSETKLQTPHTDMPEGYQPLGRAVGQVAGTIIIAENAKGMVLVDMHAAHERIIYEKLKKAFDAHDVPLQQMLIPMLVTVTAEQMAAFEESREEIAKLGLELSAVASNQLSLRAAPQILDAQVSRNGPALVRDVLDDFIAYGKSAVLAEKRNQVLARMACHAAVRVNRILSLSEIDAILRQMEQTDRADECNHGRPTWIQIPYKDLDNLFMRGK